MNIEQAVQIIEENQLECLMWQPEACLLQEYQSKYVPTGREDHVILAHKDDKYISFRMTFSGNDPMYMAEPVILRFHEDYYIFITLKPEEE